MVEKWRLQFDGCWHVSPHLPSSLTRERAPVRMSKIGDERDSTSCELLIKDRTRSRRNWFRFMINRYEVMGLTVSVPLFIPSDKWEDLIQGPIELWITFIGSCHCTSSKTSVGSSSLIKKNWNRCRVWISSRQWFESFAFSSYFLFKPVHR